MGKIPRLGTRLGGLIENTDRLYELIDRTIAFYRRNGRKKERFGHTINRIGVEKVNEEILHGT
jgi:dissimilatory sulfite reductase (desulfoviridin) alpha/beta subunit